MYTIKRVFTEYLQSKTGVFREYFWR